MKDYILKKSTLLLILLIPLLVTCEKKESQLMLDIYSSGWYTSTSTVDSVTFINIHLKVSGYSNAALLSITNGGDGMAGCSEIKCEEGNFSGDYLIYFFPANSQLHRKFGSTITAYSRREKPEIVWCDAVGSGNTISKRFESDVLP